jgi:hypothetical protein
MRSPGPEHESSYKTPRSLSTTINRMMNTNVPMMPAGMCSPPPALHPPPTTLYWKRRTGVPKDPVPPVSSCRDHAPLPLKS